MISIEQYGGLEPYLNGTAGLHGDKGYDDFVVMVDDEVIEAEMQRKFKVSRDTISRWKKQLKKEREENNARI